MRSIPRLALICTLVIPALAADEPFEPARLEREVVVPAADDPVQFDFAADGSIYFIGRAGGVKKWDAATRIVSEVGRVPSVTKGDGGALALVLGRDFASSGHLFIFYCPEAAPQALRVARFTVREGRLEPGSESLVIAIPIDGGDSPPHCGGGLGWDAQGNLLIGTGDNTPPQEVPSIHPREPSKDARRSAANSQDLRGKILRLRPRADGGYDVPAGNLFAKAEDGLPEIYVMGARNPFRLAVDAATGWLVWGDVGGNVDPALGLGPEGFDELNLASRPGFYGWPFFSGPNLAWRPYDLATRKPAGEPFDPLHPVNASPHNTGATSLPPAQPALLWYPTTPSKEWPQLGSGGRSITGGPVYRFDEKLDSAVKLPRHFDGGILWAEWMRNFLAFARLSPDGALAGVERVMPETVFRKPSDLRIGPDGALYVAEYGDAWSGNTGGQITRVVYRRGNRAPRAQASASTLAGPAPLTVDFDATGSSDADEADRPDLGYGWHFADGSDATGPRAAHVFATAGRWPVELTVRDSHGAESKTSLIISVGNTAPVVRFTGPADGGFVDFGPPLAYRVEATDAEDGALPAEKVQIQLERRDRVRTDDEESVFPGLALMRAGTCFACHRAAEKSAGPAYVEVARRYAPDSAARATLAKKILSGGAGSWGEVPMPPHPQHSLDQTRQMVDWICSLATRDTRTLPPGLSGTISLPPPPREWGAFSNGVVVLTATATDAGTAECPPLSSETTLVLRSRRQMAAAFDRAEKAVTQHNLDDGLVARIAAGGWIAMDRVNLDGIKNIRLRLRPIAGSDTRLELRAGSPTGRVLAETGLPAPTTAPGPPPEVRLALPPNPTALPTDLFFRLAGEDGAICDLAWVEFR